MKNSIYLCDLSHHSFGRFYNSDVIPWGIGCIAAYVINNIKHSFGVRLFRYPHKLSEALQQDMPMLVGFTNYMWNLDLSYSYAKYIKSLSPGTVVVFGGPNFPVDMNEQEKFLSRYPCIDFYVEGEGEVAFFELLESLVAMDFSVEEVKTLHLRSISFLHGGTIVKGEKMTRLKNLDIIPSPYLMGIFDEFFDGILRPLTQTNRGCPFSCTYCVEGSTYYSRVNYRSLDILEQELEYIAKRLHNKCDLFIANSNFGMYKRDVDYANAIARVQSQYGWPLHISAATGKNQVERVLRVADIVNGSMKISAAVQSLDPEVLSNIKRNNISTTEIVRVARLSDKTGANTISEIILSLPGDSKEKHFRTVELIVNSDVNVVASYTLMMLPGTQCATAETRMRFGMKTKFRIVSRSAGQYSVGNHQLDAAENEEVCVGSNSLSFDDYLECRVLALTLTIFYNDCIVDEALKIIRAYGFSNWSFVRAIHDGYYKGSLPVTLLELYDNFVMETNNELFDTPEDTRSSLGAPGEMERFAKGERGHNIIFKHKALALTRHIQEIHDVAFGMVLSLVKREISKKDLRAFSDYIDEIKRYSIVRKRDFLENHKRLLMEVNYDIIKAERNGYRGGFKEYILSQPRIVELFQDNYQITHIERQKRRLGGSETTSMSQLLMLIPSKKLYRRSRYKDDSISQRPLA